MLHGEQGCPGTGGDAGFGVDVLDVVADLLVEPARATGRNISTSRSVRPAGIVAAAGRRGWPAAASTASTSAHSCEAASLAVSAGRWGRSSVIAW